MSLLLSYLLQVAACLALDAPTRLRQSLSPYVFYNFMDSDSSGNNAPTTASDLANHSMIKFGDLTLGPRASWLKGRPGVYLAKEPSSATVTSALISANTFQLDWLPVFNNTPWVMEMWYQQPTFNTNGTHWSIARPDREWRGGICDEALFRMGQETGEVPRLSVAGGKFCPRPYQLENDNTPLTLALYARVVPLPTGLMKSHLFCRHRVSFGGQYDGDPMTLQWDDDQARLVFGHQNQSKLLNFNLLSFAMYPNISESVIESLFQAGLPNVKPFAPSFLRSVPENVGGAIQLCPNKNTTATQDSDCLDFTNNATHLGLNQTHTLVPSSSLEVWITQLPSRGVLSQTQGGVPITVVPFKLPSDNHSVYYTPPEKMATWYATFIQGQGGYYNFHNNTDIVNNTSNNNNNNTSSNNNSSLSSPLSFTYYVVDSDGASSSPATVTLEVFPTHTAPVAHDVFKSGSSTSSTTTAPTSSIIFAGRALPASSEPASLASASPASLLDNAIFLQVSNQEFLSPAASPSELQLDSSCGSYVYNNMSSLPLCVFGKNFPDPMNTVVTIWSLPPTSLGTLKYRDWANSGQLLDVTVGTQIAASNQWCDRACAPAWIVFWDASQVDGSTFNLTNNDLGENILAIANFTYTATDKFELPFNGHYWNNSNSSSSDSTPVVMLDELGGISSPFIWQAYTESNLAHVTVEIHDGFYAQSATSVVKQRNLSTISPQPITLITVDVTSSPQSTSASTISIYIASLPAKGALFVEGSSTTNLTNTPPLKITSVPFLLPATSFPSSSSPGNSLFSLAYQPSLPNDNLGFEYSPAYTQFQFYAVRSAGSSASGQNNNTQTYARQSATVTQTISVVDTNDDVSISWYVKRTSANNKTGDNDINTNSNSNGNDNADNTLVFSASAQGSYSSSAFSKHTPQNWTAVGSNNDLYINWTDPDVFVAGEPWYRITLQSVSSDFTIFLEDSIWQELSAYSNGNIGLLMGPSTAGEGTNIWELVVNRSTGFRALNPLRLRPNKPSSSVLSITITDCQVITRALTPIADFYTKPEFLLSPNSYASAAALDWQPSRIVANIPIVGKQEQQAEYQGVADPTILAAVYGLIVCNVLTCLGCVAAIVYWCVRRRARSELGTEPSGARKEVESFPRKRRKIFMPTIEL